MNYDETNQYLIEVTCSDAYGSSDTATLTFDVTENDASVLTNLPGSECIVSLYLRIL